MERSMSDLILKLTDENFDATISESALPIVVDYWAEWCGPCKMIAPIFADLAVDYEGKVTFAKVNIDENPLVPQKYAVRGIPTLMIFSNGEVIATKVGALSKSQLAAFVDSNCA
jgi:thioredoxin 1